MGEKYRTCGNLARSDPDHHDLYGAASHEDVAGCRQFRGTVRDETGVGEERVGHRQAPLRRSR
jgi:hypothetical protein